MQLLFKPTIAYFTVPMGILALGLSFDRFQALLGWQSSLPSILIGYGMLAFLIVTTVYLAHAAKPHQLEKLRLEWQNPFQVSFFPGVTLTLLLLLLGIDYFIGEADHTLLEIAYYVVVAIHTLLITTVLSRWLFERCVTIDHLKPTWFIMLSANFVVVITGETILTGEIHKEFLWFYYSISLLLWFSFVFMIMYRLIFENVLRIEMRPSLFIFLAPPSLALEASVLLYGSENQALSNVMIWCFYSFAASFFLFWVYAIKHFIACKLSMVSWAYVYPLSAFSAANIVMSGYVGSDIFLYFAAALLSLTLGFVVLLSAWVAKQSFRK